VHRLAEELRGPRARGVDERRAPSARARRRPPSRRICQCVGAAPASTQRVRREHGRAALGRVDRVEDDEPGVVDPAVGIDEALAKLGLSGAPAGWLRRSTVREPGSTSRRARWS
jgi:hypothetical protein